jgi:hypothetical protein
MARPAAGALALGAALAALFGAFFFVVRPWYLGWGATDAESGAALPGDEIIPNAAGQQTRAITIRAPIDRVWPWVAQIGQDRGGFYSFDLLENLIGCEMPTTDVLRPDRQAWQLGDKMWMYPREKAGGVGFATLRAYVPGRALGFGTHMTGTPIQAPEDGSWSFVLEPVDDATTRLLVRGRGVARHSLLGTAFDRGVFEPIHFVMEQRMLIGLRQVAEGQDRHRLANHAQVVLWTIAFVTMITFAVLTLQRDRWGRPLAGFVAAAVVFQILTLVQPPLWIGAALLIAGSASATGWRGGLQPARAG